MEYKPDDEFDEESPNYKRLSNAMDAVDKFELIYSTKHTTIFQVPTKDLKKLLKALYGWNWTIDGMGEDK
jgi:hypothetical protein